MNINAVFEMVREVCGRGTGIYEKRTCRSGETCDEDGGVEATRY